MNQCYYKNNAFLYLISRSGKTTLKKVKINLLENKEQLLRKYGEI